MKKLSLSSICILVSFFGAVAQQKAKAGTVNGLSLPKQDVVLELESANRVRSMLALHSFRLLTLGR